MDDKKREKEKKEGKKKIITGSKFFFNPQLDVIWIMEEKKKKNLPTMRTKNISMKQEMQFNEYYLEFWHVNKELRFCIPERTLHWW